jgi:hypothetical protein
MPDELDPELTRLFAAADEVLPTDRFTAETLQLLRRDRRLRTIKRVGFATAIIAAAAAVAPFVADVSVEIARYGGSGIDRFADMLVSPFGVSASLVVAFVVLGRIRALLR